MSGIEVGLIIFAVMLALVIAKLTPKIVKKPLASYRYLKLLAIAGLWLTLKQFGLFLLVVAAWQLLVVAGGIPPYLLPSPARVAAAAWHERATLLSAVGLTAAGALAGIWNARQWPAPILARNSISIAVEWIWFFRITKTKSRRVAPPATGSPATGCTTAG